MVNTRIYIYIHTNIIIHTIQLASWTCVSFMFCPHARGLTKVTFGYSEVWCAVAAGRCGNDSGHGSVNDVECIIWIRLTLDSCQKTSKNPWILPKEKTPKPCRAWMSLALVLLTGAWHNSYRWLRSPVLTKNTALPTSSNSIRRTLSLALSWRWWHRPQFPAFDRECFPRVNHWAIWEVPGSCVWWRLFAEPLT